MKAWSVFCIVSLPMRIAVRALGYMWRFLIAEPFELGIQEAKDDEVARWK